MALHSSSSQTNLTTPRTPIDPSTISQTKIDPLFRHGHGYPSPPNSTTSSDPWSQHQHQHQHIMDLNLSNPVTGLDGSWRMEDHPSRRGTGGGKEVVWDIKGLGLGLDAMAMENHERDPLSETLARLTDPSGSGPGEGGEKGKGKEKEKENEKTEVLGVEVWAKVMDTSRGRDKVLKCAQYSLRTYLYLLTIIARLRPLSPWFRSNHKRVKLAISGLSLTRKCLLLLNPLHPLTDLLSPHPMSARTLLSHLIDLISAISDDVYCLSRLGLVGKKTGGIADRWSNRFWFLTTIMGLYKIHFKTIPRLRSSYSLTTTTSQTLEKRRTELSEAEWTNRKLLADLLFVSYDVFELNWPVLEEPMKCLAGLTAGFISTMKLYNAQWDASVGKG
ncbi:hypothetical protein CI109_100666 [Kwoniella shandongensis]|uniref:Uncharacterized protein n=1 Tax=Kwoniella shandongensis TaxID=1734106 RepID=A0A5M6C3J0_9TREE|nr:uncharacterized protein CI109_003413 [Kwoniella shandongensis]KAA5528125.1 hypothetical protein CI109_003413 [Kwoniella shandongensis]